MNVREGLWDQIVEGWNQIILLLQAPKSALVVSIAGGTTGGAAIAGKFKDTGVVSIAGSLNEWLGVGAVIASLALPCVLIIVHWRRGKREEEQSKRNKEQSQLENELLRLQIQELKPKVKKK